MKKFRQRHKMFSRQENMLREALAVKYKDSARIGWKLKDKVLVPIVKSAQSAIEKKPILNKDHAFELIKEESNRMVFKITSKSNAKSYIFKVFPSQCLKHRLKYIWMTRNSSRFAYGEAISLLIASEKGINVPDVYGYGYILGTSMLIEKSVLIIECLSHHTTIGELLESHRDNQEKCLQILNRAIPLFVKLYEAACNHISVNTGAIMLSNDKDPENDFILDFEYAKFYKKPSLELLMFEAATLAKYCKAWVSKDTMKE
ncbi:hypothetical protein KAR91_41340, partial [Candidatus Pacearchaeota archaeon]|nr:hypothetical protein [Candidatus Pacearchaeota archaeon]